MLNIQEKTQAIQQVIIPVLKRRGEQTRISLVTNGRIGLATLGRWTSGKSFPSDIHLRELAQAFLPEDKQKLVPLLVWYEVITEEEVALLLSASPSLQTPQEQEISSSFVLDIIRSVSETYHGLRIGTICRMVLTESLLHLGAQMSISVLICTLPEEGKPVQTLCELAFLEQGQVSVKSRFLQGEESLAARACITLEVETDMLSMKYSVAVPLLRSGLIGGCVLFSSTQPFSPTTLETIHTYTRLLALAFTEAFFYEKERLQFIRMPSSDSQVKLFGQMNMMVTLQSLSARNREEQAHIWHEMEESCRKLIL